MDEKMLRDFCVTGNDWQLAGFIATDRHPRGAVESWRYPEYGWAQWLPGLQLTRRTNLSITELWLYPINNASEAVPICESLAAEAQNINLAEVCFDVLSIDDSGRLVTLNEAIKGTPLETKNAETPGLNWSTLEGAQQRVSRILEYDRDMTDRFDEGYLNHSDSWCIAAYQMASEKNLGDKGIQPSFESLVALTSELGLECWAVAASHGGEWIQFALTSEDCNVKAECYLGYNWTQMDVYLNALNEGNSVSFGWSMQSPSMIDKFMHQLVQLTALMSRGEYRFKTMPLSRTEVVVVKGFEDRHYHGKVTIYKVRREGPLSFAFGPSIE